LGRSFAWLGNFRRRLIRWELLFIVYRGFFAFAAMLLSIGRQVRCAAGTPAAYR
jgi:hypothetical protein